MNYTILIIINDGLFCKILENNNIYTKNWTAKNQKKFESSF